MEKGWIKLYRDSINNPVFRKPLIWHYFEYCLLKASHEDQEIIWNGKKMIIERGSFITGRKKAAEETGLSEQNIRTALTTLELQSMVVKSTNKSTNKFSYLTVCNYENYQDKNNDSGHQINQQPTSNQPHTRMYKNEKNIYVQSFNFFWNEYPKKINKKKAKAIWLEKIRPENGLCKKIMSGLERAKLSKDWQKDSGQFIPHPTTWLNGERWNDEEIALTNQRPTKVAL